MNRLVIVAAILATAIALAALAAVELHGSARVQAGEEIPPARFFGTITVDGAPPALGTVVRARIDGNLCGQGQVQNIAGVGLGYMVDVMEQTSPGFSGCGALGRTVAFEWVSGVGQVLPCSPRGSWDNSSFIRLDLSCFGPTQLFAGWNFVLWLPDKCVTPQQAFQQLIDEGILNVAAKFIPQTQSWQIFDPDAPPAVNDLTQVCPNDALAIHVSAGTIWQQDP
ncbi:MAG: hypothetical protein ACE5IZ_03530 [Dehalococcoidia bacterium]